MGFEGKRIEYSPEWKGPLKNRSCTDWPCLIIFVIFMAVWIGVGSYVFVHVDIMKTIAPEDSEGRKCGYDESVEDAPYLVFFDPRKCLNSENKCRTPQVCRKACPTENWIYLADWDFDLDNTREQIICKTGIDPSSKTANEIRELVKNEDCAPWNLNSTSIVGRCIPVINDELLEILEITMEDANDFQAIMTGLQTGVDMVQTLISTRNELLGFLTVGAAVCLIYIFLLRWLAFPMVLLSIGAICGSLSYGAFVFHDRWVSTNNTSFLILWIILACLAALIALLVLLLFNRIRLACQLIKESSNAVMSILSSLFFPIFPWLFHLAAISYAIAVGICFSTDTLPIARTYFYVLVVVHVFGFIWFYCFVTAIGDMVLAATFATWYWTFRKSEVPWFTVAAGTWTTIRYHLGTVAFGSFLITLIRSLRIVLEVSWRAFAQSTSADMACLPLACCALWCSSCLGVIERIFKYMNRNAYIVCAVYGKGLCSSAADAVGLLLRNSARAILLNNIVAWLLFVGKITIAALMGVASWQYFTKERVIAPSSMEWLPITVVVIGTYLVANIFFKVYDVAVDTIFMCFLEDCERHDGSIAKPYYMSYRLRKLLHKKNER